MGKIGSGVRFRPWVQSGVRSAPMPTVLLERDKLNEDAFYDVILLLIGMITGFVMAKLGGSKP